MSKKANELVLERNFFYYKYTKQLNRVNLLYLLVLGLLIGFYTYYTRTISAKPVYFATTPAGVIINNPPLSFNHLSLQYQAQFVDYKTDYIYNMPEPKVTFTKLQELGDDALIKWATLVATEIHTTNFKDYDNNLQNISQAFTKDGYQSFLNILAETNVESDVKSKGIRVTAIAINQAVMVSEAANAWVIQVPLLITYQGLSESSTQKYVASNLYVINVPTDQAKTGIGVNKLIETSDYKIGMQ